MWPTRNEVTVTESTDKLQKGILNKLSILMANILSKF